MLNKETQKKIMKIMKLALEKNSIEKNTVFVDFSGHTNGLQVQIYENGWKAYENPDYNEICYFEHNNANEKLDELIKRIKELD
jgi:hypothetical protein|nr:MAG TPA: hypothetical protein [Caudoviricetes sp.]